MIVVITESVSYLLLGDSVPADPAAHTYTFVLLVPVGRESGHVLAGSSGRGPTGYSPDVGWGWGLV